MIDMKLLKAPSIIAGLVNFLMWICPIQAQTEFTWRGSAEGEWNSQEVWQDSTGEGKSWMAGAIAKFPALKTEEIAVTVDSEVVADAVIVQKNFLRIQGSGTLVLDRENQTDGKHTLNLATGGSIEVPVVLAGGGMQTWLSGSGDRVVTISKGIKERSPTGITFSFGTLRLESPSSFSGGIALNNAILELANESGAGTGEITMGSQKNTISVVGGNLSINNGLTTPYIGGDTVIPWIFEGSGQFTIKAPVTLQGTDRATVSISIARGLAVAFQEGILPVAGRSNCPLGLTLSGGDGTLILEKEVSYQGPTKIESGRLMMNGASEQQKSWTVSKTGILSGRGTIGLATDADYLSIAGKLSPGTDTSVGTLRIFGSAKLGAGFEYSWNFGAKPGEGDLLSVGGSLLPDSAWGPWKVVVRPAEGASLASGKYTWPILTAQSPIAPEAIAQATVEFAASTERYSGELRVNGTSMELVLTVK